MPTIQELGQKVKAKYPGAYDDMSDIEVGYKVKAKYPNQYAEFTDPAPDGIVVGKSSFPEQSFTKKTTGVLKDVAIGFGKGAASTVANLGSMAQKALDVPSGFVTQAITGKEFTPNQTLNQALGDTLDATSTAQKVGKGIEQVAEFLTPGGVSSKVGKAAELASTGTKIAKGAKVAKALATAGTEALTSAGITMAQGGSVEDAKNTAVATTAINAVAGGLGKLLKSIPETAWSSILKRTPALAAKNPNLTTQAAETGLVGLSRESIAYKAGREIQNIEVALDEVLKNSKGKIAPLKIAPYLDELRNSYSKIPGEESSLEAINKVAKDFLSKKTLTPTEANDMKRAIYQNISNSYGKGVLDIPAKADAQKAIARGLKDEINSIIPEAKTLNEKQAVYVQIKKALEKTIARGEGKGIAGTGIGLLDLGAGGVAQIAGLATGNPLAGIAGVMTSKVLQSPAVLSASSKLINHFNTLSPTKKLLFYQAINGLTSNAIRQNK